MQKNNTIKIPINEIRNGFLFLKSGKKTTYKNNEDGCFEI